MIDTISEPIASSHMSGTKSLCDTWTIYKTMLDLDRTKLQLKRTANWYNNCGVKSLLQS